MGDVVRLHIYKISSSLRSLRLSGSFLTEHVGQLLLFRTFDFKVTESSIVLAFISQDQHRKAVLDLRTPTTAIIKQIL